ncbi:hypothetical protein [Paracoccus sphaerophysae]|uniref:hypothetical protein n=1 Tax=Paracoccus sphaerophysae TaxID=690417 RepID=UPI000A6B6631|nr:hypothetical protein [Paracoccus sphaerophysae]
MAVAQKNIFLRRNKLGRLLATACTALVLTAFFGGSVSAQDENGSEEAEGHPSLIRVAPIINPDRLSELPSFDRPDLQLLSGYYKKALADELFLQRKHVDARTEYKSALETLESISGLSSAGATSARSLLITDARYRIELLDVGADYWGSGLTTRPGIPAIHLANMNSLLLEFETLNAEINASIQGQDNAQILKSLVRAQSHKAVADLRASAPASEMQRAVQDQYEARVRLASNKKAALEERIGEAVAEREAFMQAADQAALRAAAAVTAAVVSATGVDPQIVSALRSGDVEGALVGVAVDSGLYDQAALLNQVQASAASALELNETISEVRKYVSQIEELKREVDGYVSGFASLQEYVENPTADSLLNLGRSVLNSEVVLPAEIERMRESIRVALPVEGLIQLAQLRQDEFWELVPALQTALGQSDNWTSPDLASELADIVIPENEAEFALFASSMLEFAIISTEGVNSPVRASAIKAMFKIWPRRVFEGLPNPVQEAIQAHIGEGVGRSYSARSAQELSARLQEVQFGEADGHLIARLDRDAVQLGSIRDLVWETKGAPPDVPLPEATAAAHEFAVSAMRDATDLREFFLSSLGISDFGELALEVAERGEADEMLGFVRQIAADDVLDEAATSLAALEVGAAIKASLAEEAMAFSAASGASGQLEWQSAFTDVATRQLAQAALDAALPGLGTVGLAVSDYLDSVAEFDSNMRRARSLDSEIASLSQAAYRQAEVLDDAARTLGAIRAGAERDEIYRQAAVSQIEELAAAQDVALEIGQRQEEIALRRLPQVFYLAEMLRREYDLFEASLSAWVGGDAGARGVIKELILDDPDLTRLVLDRDVHLFRWFDRRSERQRGSPDSVLTHWRQLYRLATDICREHGCLPGNSVLGNYGDTGPISVRSRLSPDEWSEFLSWAADHGSSGTSHVLTIVVGPGDGTIADSFLNARTIDIGLSGIDSANSEVELQVLVANSGFGLVRTAHGFSRETFRRQGPSAIYARARAPHDLSRIASRWSHERPARMPFEGYALYGNWELVVPWNARLIDLSDIEISFAYFFLSEPIGAGTGDQVGDEVAEVAVTMSAESSHPGEFSFVSAGRSNLPVECASIGASLEPRRNPGSRSQSVSQGCEDLPPAWRVRSLEGKLKGSVVMEGPATKE